MIAVDTSALVAIALGEDEMIRFDREIARQGAAIGVPTLLETAMVLARWMPRRYGDFVERLVARNTVTVIALDERQLAAALDGHRRFGKGRGHPAQLNFGDCLSYAVALVGGWPLLVEGSDFAGTDIRSALP